MFSLMRHEIRVRRRTILGWALGLGFFALMYMAFYPALPEELRSLDMASIDIYKSMGVRSMATFEGYMQSTVLNFLPLLVGAFGIVLGAGALAGDEDAGTLELLAALPISRLQLYVAKAAAVLLAALLVLFVVAVGQAAVFLALESEIDTSVSALDLFWVVLGNWLIAFVFVALALFLGAFLPSRGSALAVAAALLVAAFFANSLSALVTDLERIQPLLPFSYFVRFTESLGGAVPWDDVGALAAMGIAALALGALGFRRRDLTVGAWPWQRLRSGAPAAAPAPRDGRRRRLVVPLAVVAIALCGCIGVAAAALAVSGDLREDVRDWLGIDEDEIVASGEVVERLVPVTAAVAGHVISVLVSVGDEVEVGASVVVLTDEAESVRIEAQLVIENGAAFLEDLAAGAPGPSAVDAAIALEKADAAAEAATRQWRDARAMGESRTRVTELEARHVLAGAARSIVQARLAFAEGTLRAADLDAVLEALKQAESTFPGDPLVLRSVNAPVTGSVSEILVESGDAVEENQAVARILDRGASEVVVRLAAEVAERVRLGQAVEIEVVGVEETIEGRVVEVFQGTSAGDSDANGEADGDELEYAVRIAIQGAPLRLAPGARAEARFPLE